MSKNNKRKNEGGPKESCKNFLSLNLERFCREYQRLDGKKGCGRDSAICAGYSKNSATQKASNILKRADVQSRLMELREEQYSVARISTDWVVFNLVEIVNRSMKPVPFFMKTGIGQAPIDPDAKIFTFDAKNAVKALELIGKNMGMFAKDLEDRDKMVEINVKLGE